MTLAYLLEKISPSLNCSIKEHILSTSKALRGKSKKTTGSRLYAYATSNGRTLPLNRTALWRLINILAKDDFPAPPTVSTYQKIFRRSGLFVLKISKTDRLSLHIRHFLHKLNVLIISLQILRIRLQNITKLLAPRHPIGDLVTCSSGPAYFRGLPT